MLLTVFMAAGVALAVHEIGLFELDENAVAEGLNPPDDWDLVQAGTDSALKSEFQGDPFESSTDDIFATNSKDTLDITGWQWKVGEPNDKNDIEHGFLALYEDDGDQILYFGIDFLANNGDKAVGVWVLQDDVAQITDTSPPNFPFTGQHIEGDILLQADFTNGGQLSRVDVYTWGPNNLLNEKIANQSELYKAFEGQDCDTSVDDDLACAQVNDQIVPAPWDYSYKCVGTAQPPHCAGLSGVQPLTVFPVSTFFEGGVNVSELLGRSLCAGSVVFETRQSQSETSVVEDKMVVDFDLCSIDVDKDGPALGKVGDDNQYTVTVTNDGSVTLYKDSIVDSLVGDLTDGTNAAIDTNDCGASLAPTDSCTITYTYTVQEGDPDPLENTVTVIYDSQADLSGDEVTDSDDHSVNLFQPDISVDKTGDTLSKVGDDVSYTVTITNDSSSDSPDLIFDLIDDSLVGDLTDGTNAAIDTNDCGASLAPTDSCTITYTYTVQEGDTDPLENTVTVESHPDGFTNDIDDSDDHSVNLFQPDISVDKTGDTLSKVGDDVSYTVTITNDSSSDSPDLVFDSIDDSLVGDLTDSANYDSSTCGASIAWDESCVITYTYTVQEGDTDPLENTVTVESHPDGFTNDIDDSDDHSVNLFQPDISVDKTGDTLSKVGDDVSYTVTITNDSSSDSPDLVFDSIDDSLVGDLTDSANYDSSTCGASIAWDESCVITYTYTVQEGDPDPLENTVTVESHPDGFTNDIDDSDDHSVNLFQPSVTIEKTGDELSKVGDPVDYTITVTNTSSTDSPNLVCDITDDLLGTLAEDVELAPGAEHVINTSRVVLEGDPDPLINEASVICGVVGFSNIIGPETDDHTTNLFQPAVEVVKSGPSEAGVGETITYSFTINNLSSSDSPNLILDSVSDTVVGDITTEATAGGCGELASAGTCNFTADYTIQGSDPNPLVNVVTVHYHPDGFPNDITDDDDHSLEIVGGEGCTPGFWQGGNGISLWDDPDDDLSDAVEAALTTYGLVLGDDFYTDAGFDDIFGGTDTRTLLEIVGSGGGPDFEDKAKRDLIAALLNAVDSEIDYPASVTEILDDFFDGDFGAFHEKYGAFNELGCDRSDAASMWVIALPLAVLGAELLRRGRHERKN